KKPRPPHFISGIPLAHRELSRGPTCLIGFNSYELRDPIDHALRVLDERLISDAKDRPALPRENEPPRGVVSNEVPERSIDGIGVIDRLSLSRLRRDPRARLPSLRERDGLAEEVFRRQVGERPSGEHVLDPVLGSQGREVAVMELDPEAPVRARPVRSDRVVGRLETFRTDPPRPDPQVDDAKVFE